MYLILLLDFFFIQCFALTVNELEGICRMICKYQIRIQTAGVMLEGFLGFQTILMR